MFLQRLVLLHPSHRLHLGQRVLPGLTFPLVYVQNGCLSWIKTKYQPCAGNLSQWISGENVLWSVCQQTINTSLPFHNSSVYMWRQHFLRNCNTLCIELNPWIMQKHCTQICHYCMRVLIYNLASGPQRTLPCQFDSLMFVLHLQLAKWLTRADRVDSGLATWSAIKLKSAITQGWLWETASGARRQSTQLLLGCSPLTMGINVDSSGW